MMATGALGEPGGAVDTSAGTESAARVADVLLLFTGGPSTLGVSRAARELGLSKAVVHRILRSLAARGMVSCDADSRQYRLGPAAAALGARALRECDLRSAATDLLHRLRDETAETATLTALVPHGRVCLDQVPGTHEIKMTVELGRPFPLHAGSSGKCMLAFLASRARDRVLAAPLEALTANTVTDADALRTELELIAARGYAVSAGERQADAGSVAAPVLGATGEVIGAISVCGPRYRVTADLAIELAPRVLAAAGEVSRRMGWPGPP